MDRNLDDDSTVPQDQHPDVIGAETVPSDPEATRNGQWAALDAILDAVLVVDGEGRIMFANRAAAPVFGYEQHGLIGRPVESLVPPEGRRLHLRLRHDYAGDPRPRPLGGGRELRAVRRDGSSFPAEISLSPVSDSGRPLIAAVIRDLTATRLQEQTQHESDGLRRALEVSDQRFQMAFKDSSIGMLVVSARPDRLGIVLEVNQAFCDLLGRSEEDLLGQDARNIFLIEDFQAALALHQAMRTGRITSAHDIVRRVVHADGHDLWVALTAGLMRDEHGDPDCYFISQVLDVTERRRARLETQLLVERDRRIALILQEGLQPTVPDQVGHVRVATRYRAAGESAVGGDWHDVFALPDGRIGLTVGDVAGHGIESAATMSRLRYAVRMLATAGADPAEVMTRLNQVMLDPDRPSADIEIATVVHAQLDPPTGDLLYCSAGHLPMIRLPAGGPDGSRTAPRVARPLAALGGPPIGVVHHLAYIDHHVVLDPGDILIGFTDGLIERRGRSLEEGLLALLTGLNHVPDGMIADVEAVADEVLRLAPPGGWVDDTAVMVIANPPLLPSLPAPARS